MQCWQSNQHRRQPKGVPPVFYLKTGKWIAHILINAKSPNETSSGAPGGKPGDLSGKETNEIQ